MKGLGTVHNVSRPKKWFKWKEQQRWLRGALDLEEQALHSMIPDYPNNDTMKAQPCFPSKHCVKIVFNVPMVPVAA